MANAAATKKKAKGGEEVPLVLKDGVTGANADSLLRALEVYGVEYRKNTSAAELLELVRGHLDAVLKERGHVCDEQCEDPANTVCPKLSCSRCKEWATEDTPFCPFCGDEGTDSGLVESSVEEEVVDSTVDEEEEGAQEEVESGADEAEAEAADDVPVEGGGELAEAPESGVDAYETAITRIKGLLRNMAANGYDLGLQFRAIHEQELWKARGFSSFADFVDNGGTGVKKSLAYDLMDLTEKFTREAFLAAGATNLRLIATVEDPEKRNAAMDAAKAGASTRTVARLVDEANGKPGRSGKAPSAETPKRPEPPAPATPSRPSAKENTITLLAKVNGKPVNHPFVSEKGSQLKHFAHDKGAYVEVPLSEDMVMQVGLKLDKKVWEAMDAKARRAVESVLEGITVRFVPVVNG